MVIFSSGFFFFRTDTVEGAFLGAGCGPLVGLETTSVKGSGSGSAVSLSI